MKMKARTYSPFRVLQSDRGQVLIAAIVISVVILVMTGFLLQQSLQTEKQLRIPRVKSVMNGIEAKIRLASLQPQTFSCPTNATAGFNSSQCTMNTTFSEFAELIPGCRTAAGAPCGVAIENVSLVGTTLRADVVYKGTELSIKPMELTFETPPDVLQATDSNCASIDPTKPVFAGYLADGSLDCRPLPSDCPPGQYASSVNVSTLALNCMPLPTAANACASNQYMTGVSWTGGPTFTVTCAPRLNPFTYFSFTPSLTVRTTAYGAPSAMPANGACTPSACTPGAVTDTGCSGAGTMATWNGCTAGTRPEVSCGAAATPTCTPSQARLGGSCGGGGHPINWSFVCVTANTASFSWECANAAETVIVPCPAIDLQDLARCPGTGPTPPPTPTPTPPPSTPGTWVRGPPFVDLASHGPGVSCTSPTLPAAACCPAKPATLGEFINNTPPACPCDSSIAGQRFTIGATYGAYHEYVYTCSP